VQNRVENNMWQSYPTFKFHFFIFYQKSFCMFHRGHLRLTLVQNFCKNFCKENDSLMNWNKIKDFFMSHLF
jgi:hypothetical protein